MITLEDIVLFFLLVSNFIFIRKLMGAFEDLEAGLTDLKETVSAKLDTLAEKVNALQGQVGTSPITAAQLTQLQADITAAKEALSAKAQVVIDDNEA